MSAPAAVEAASTVRRSLGRFDLICIGLNAIVGSGIFALPDDLYREMTGLSPLAFLLCALGLLPVALCYAEAGSRVDRNGGPYVYASLAFGRPVGFAVGWMCFANAVFSYAAVASFAAASAAAILPALSGEARTRATGVGIVVAFAVLNYFGAKPGARAVALFTIAKFAVLFLLVGALVPHASFDAVSTELPRGAAGVGSAVFIALFAAQGFEVVPVTAGETHAPQRHVPLAVIASLLAVSLLYVVVQTVLVGSFAGLGGESESPVADAALAVSPSLGFVVAVGGLVSALGFVSGSALGTPRYLYAAAVDGHVPARLAAVHPRFASPYFAVLATSALAAALVIGFDYRALIGMSNVAVAVQYLATSLAVPVLRRREGRAPVHLPGGWTLPLAGAAVSIAVFFYASLVELGWAVGSLAVGVLLTVLSRRLV